MDIARIIGTVVATKRDPAWGDYRLSLVQPLTEKLESSGNPVVAVNSLNLNRGDLVYLIRSGDAMFAHPGDWNVPTDCAIGGLIDEPLNVREKKS